MTAVRPPKQRRSRESYERVLDAAHALLEENGFEGLTVQEVAARSGVSIGAIYERFGNKETLLRAVHARLMEAMSEGGADARDPVAARTPPRPRLPQRPARTPPRPRLPQRSPPSRES
jgi:AcrR family transcriptional regulator